MGIIFNNGFFAGVDPNAILTPTPTLTQTITPTITQTLTPTITPTLSQTITPTLSVTPTLTQTITPTLTQTITPTLTVTPTITQTLTPTPTPTPAGGDAIRSALTTSVTAYDAATVGNFVKVTAAEYANVISTVSGVTIRGLTEVQANQATSAWTGTCAHIQQSGTTASPAGEYIIGFSAKLSGSSGTISVLTSTTYAGTYTVLENSPAMNSANGREYFIRKSPTTANSATTYVGSVTTANRSMTTTTFSNTYYDCSAPYSSWSVWSSGVPVFQFIGTSIKSW